MIQILPNIRLHITNDNKGTYINALILEHDGDNYHLQGGTKDTIYAFTESLGIYVLTINKAIGSVGLNAFMSPEPDALNSTYLNNNQEIMEALGINWDVMEPVDMVRKLIDYLF